ncbi:DNA (cytosine-5-)-methyltransferase [Nonomuraea fuscirosea]|uniref:DNA cytosine methyltransferase n=1 Tax=Nonomuraea fuscirosea TaxID=1291556 RepID=UPI00342BA989
MTPPVLVTAGSMCSGYGGLDLAVSAVLGTRLLWLADNDADAARVLAHRFPDVPNLADLTRVDWSAVPAPDVLAIGFPCQPFSAAGHRRGIQDERWLFDDIADAVGRMGPRPRLLVLENVPGLLTVNGGHAMARVVSRLAALGYVGRYRTVRACDVGAAHQRARVFIGAWLPEPAHAPSAGLEERRQGPPAPGADAAADAAHLRHQRSRQTLAGRVGPAHSSQPAATDPESHGRQQRRTEPTRRQGRTQPHIGHRTSGAVEWGPYTAAIRRWERITGRPAPEPTEPAPRGGRRLAPAFSEWLMGLPAGWVTAVPDISRNGQLRLLGNGVLPDQAIAALHALIPSHLLPSRLTVPEGLAS